MANNSLFFDGANDRVVYPPVDLLGAFTLLVLVKRNSDGAWHALLNGETTKTGAGANNYTLEISNTNGPTIGTNGGGTGATISMLVADGWMLFVATKAAGTVIPNIYVYKFTANTTTTIAANSTQPNASALTASGGIILGEWLGSDDFSGYIAAAAVFDVALTTAQIDGIRNAKTTQSIRALNPLWLVDASDSLVNDLSSGGLGDQISKVGAVANVDVPAGWTFGLAGGVVNINGQVATTAQATSAVARIKGATRPLASTAKGTTATAAQKAAFRSVATVAQGVPVLTTSKGISRTVAVTAQALVSAATRKGGVGITAITAQGTTSVSTRKGGIRAIAINAQGTVTTTRTKGVLATIAIPGQGTVSTGGRKGAFRSLVDGGRGLIAVTTSTGGIHSFSGVLAVTASAQAAIAGRKGALRPFLVSGQGIASTTWRKGVFRTVPMSAQAIASTTGRLGSFRGLFLAASGGVQLRTSKGQKGNLSITVTGLIVFQYTQGGGGELPPAGPVLDLSSPLYICPANRDDFMYPFVSAHPVPHRILSVNPPVVGATAGTYHLKCGGCGFEITQALHGPDRRG